jgi:ATP-dependent DNA helicase UvrD/PcrA
VALAEFESMQGFLEHVSLVMDNDEAAGDDKVALMTLHAAKGLEFDTVFLPGWEEGLFPNQRALEEGGAAALEEERRLAYVGLTRARRRAIVSYAANRLVYGYWQSALPSRFIGELPAENVVQSAPTGMFGAELRRRASSADRAWPETGAGALAETRWTSRRNPPPLIEGRAERVTARPEPAHPFSPGQRVFHQKFGYGSVRAVDGERLEIAFEKAGTKTVIHSFVQTA